MPQTARRMPGMQRDKTPGYTDKSGVPDYYRYPLIELMLKVHAHLQESEKSISQGMCKLCNISKKFCNTYLVRDDDLCSVHFHRLGLGLVLG
jgi:hypothetical protein